MIGSLNSVRTLLLAIFVLMAGSGFLSTLIAIRLEQGGQGALVIGLAATSYFGGLTLGALRVSPLIARVGHIRSFGAMASLASTSILVHVVFIDPWVWWAMRLVTGFAFAGLFVVAESWLNDAAENETRGQLLSFYMLITLGGMAGGQFMLNIASPSSYELFVLISALVSIAVIPILLSVAKAPEFNTSESVSIFQLYQVSPLGVFGMLVNGVMMGAIFGMGAVYATAIGLSVPEVSLFMGSMVLGGAILQFPLGRMSDIVGRRQVIIGACAAGVAVAIFATNFDYSGWILYLVVALIGGFATPLYALCVAHTNDHLSPSQMVAASGTLVLAGSIGACLGAPITAIAMEQYGSQAFFYTIGISMAVVCVFGLWRMTQRDAISSEDTSDFVVLAPTPMSAVLNPEIELEEIVTANEVDAEAVQESFEELVNDLANPE